MNIDTFLKIGHSHTMCQDYILSGTEPFPYIILADGCSSAADSDIGARVLCYTALKYLQDANSKCLASLIFWKPFGWNVIKDAASIIKRDFPTLSVECLDATLIVAVKIEGVYKICMFGDGHIYYIDNDDEMRSHHHRITYEPNAPAYLRYIIKGCEEYCNNNITKIVDVDYIQRKFPAFGSYHDPAYLGYSPHYYTSIPENKIKSLIIASDGVDSIMYKDEMTYKTRYLNMCKGIKSLDGVRLQKQEIGFLAVLEQMTMFKSTDGAFLSRRVKKVLKEYAKDGFVNDDDLSIGCFHEE